MFLSQKNCLIRPHWFIFAFISVSLEDWPKKTFVWLMSENVLPMFSSKILMVFCLMLKSLSHFEFIFVRGVRVFSSFFDLSAAVQFSQHHLLKRLSSLHFIFLPPLSKINWPLVSGFISKFSILFHLVSMSVFVPVPHYLDDCSFVIISDVWESYACCLVFVLRIALAVLGLLQFHIHFGVVGSILWGIHG